MSLATNIINGFTAVAAALKATRVLMNGNASDNSALSTTAKGSLLAAINEVYSIANAAASSGGAVINDSTASTSQTYSSSKSTSVANAAAASAAAAIINDAAASSATGTTYSASKITSAIAALITDAATAAGTTWSSTKISSYVTSQIQSVVAAAPGALDTLKELADAIGDDANFAGTMTTALSNRIRIDAAQSYTQAQITQAQSNLVALGMATAASVTTVQGNVDSLSTNVGSTTTDFATSFNNALAS